MPYTPSHGGGPPPNLDRRLAFLGSPPNKSRIRLELEALRSADDS